jgi:toluene monooxygenase system ferredoxin subunit
MTLERAASLDDVWPGEKIGVIVGGTKVLLVNVDGALRAYEDRCVHQAVRLSEGRLEGSVLTCRLHEWQYDACTGRGINPAGVALRCFPLVVRDGSIFIELDALAAKPHDLEAR